MWRRSLLTICTGQPLPFPVRVRCYKTLSTMTDPCLSNMLLYQRAAVYNEDKDNIIIKLTLGGKQRSLTRLKSEPGASLTNGKKKKQRKTKDDDNNNNAKDSEPPPLEVILYDESLQHDAPPIVIDQETSNEVAWGKSGRKLKIGPIVYELIVNPPSVNKIVIKGKPMAHLPLVPSIKLDYANIKSSQFEWFRSKDTSIWERIAHASDWCYAPIDADVGHKLKLKVTPGMEDEDGKKRFGEPLESICETAVAHGPELFAYSKRSQYTEQRCSFPLFRVVTYNLLADQYASTDYALEHLFSFCAKKYMDIEYRKQLILAELVAYNADIIMLQEVDTKLFREYYAPYLETHGFMGVYSKKEGRVSEGCSLFVRQEQFQLVEHQTISLRNVFGHPDSKIRQFFSSMLKASPDLEHALQKVTTIGQMVIIEPTNGLDPPLCLVNTHLFFHPGAPHIRLMQIFALITEAKNLMSRYTEQRKRTPLVLFGGDLNSAHGSGAIEFLLSGTVSIEHQDWKAGASFRWGHEDEEGEELEVDSTDHVDNDSTTILSSDVGVNLSHPFTLQSADNLSVAFTNYVNGYIATLDYIWYDSSGLKVKQFVPLPDEEEVKNTYCPSQRFPSDHLAVICDLEYQRIQ